MLPPSELRTRRLLLRLPSLEDAEAIFARYACDPEVTRYLTWRPHGQIETTRDFLRRCASGWEEGSSFSWVITLAGCGELTGGISLRPGDHGPDIGYVMARDVWNRGYATEAARAVVDWAIAQPGVYRVWAVCDAENLASARVLEKAGMQREGLLRRWMRHPSAGEQPRDCWCYARVR